LQGEFPQPAIKQQSFSRRSLFRGILVRRWLN